MKRIKETILPELNPTERANSAILTMSIGLGINFLLFIVKIYVGLSSNSLAVMSDAINNLGDTFSCIIAVISFALVKKGKDGKLAFGYGRMEFLSDFLMAVIVCVVAAGFVYSAVERMVLPYLMTFTWFYFGIIAFTALVKVGMVFFYRYRNKRVNSGVLRASAFDSVTDVGITVMSLIGFSLNRYAKLRIDAIFGLIISGIMIFNGIKLLISSVRTLLGEKTNEADVKKVSEILLSFEQVKEVTNVVLHNYGAQYKELVVEVIFTSEENYDIISNIAEEAKVKIKKEFGYEPKICISR